MAPDFDATGMDAADAAGFEAQARDAFAENRLPRAMIFIDKAIELEPESFDAWSFRAKILVAMERGEEALASIDRALEIEPHDYDALAEKSGILSMFANDIENGLTFAKLAYAEMIANVSPQQRADTDGVDYWAVDNVYNNLYYALYRANHLEDAAKVREEAASFGHDFIEGIDEGEEPPTITFIDS